MRSTYDLVRSIKKQSKTRNSKTLARWMGKLFSYEVENELKLKIWGKIAYLSDSIIGAKPHFF